MATPNPGRKEDAELEKSYRSVAGKYARKKAPKKSNTGAIIAICVTVGVLLIAAVAVIMILFGGQFFGDEPTETTTEYLKMTIAGVDVSGMTQEEVVNALKLETEGIYDHKIMVVTIGEDVIELTPQLTGASFDVQGYVEALYAAEESQRPGIRICDYLNLDKTAIMNALTPIIEKTESVRVNGSVELVTSETETPEGTEPTTIMTLVVTMGTPGIDLDINDIYNKILVAYDDMTFSVNHPLEEKAPELPDIEAAYEEYKQLPEDAIMDMETFEVTPHKFGYEFDIEEVKAFVEQAAYGEHAEFSFREIEPEVMTEELEGLLFRDVLGTYTAVSASQPSTRDVNLRKSCEAINGIVMKPGDVFDYNAALGERTPEAGWKQADGYMGTETTLQYGGGICQASSALYYCCLIADLEIVTRTNHGFISAYMPPGMDATVSWGWPDYKFKNSTEYPIKIEAVANGGTVTVSLIGTDTKDYYVEMEYETLQIVNWKTVEEEMPADNEKGYKNGDQITSPYTGYTIQTYKCKYNKETKELISREKWTYDIYNHRDRVVAKIIDETEPSEPTDTTTPGETQPDTQPETQPETQPGIQPDDGLSGSGGGIGEG